MRTHRQRRLLERALRSLETNPSMALESVDQLLEAGIRGQELHMLRARALQRLGREGEAGATFEELLAANGSDRQLAFEALDCYLKGFDYRAIKRLLPSLVNPHPQQERELILCIRAAQALRQSELALQLCESLVDALPQNPVHICKLGTFYQSFGHMGEAEQAFKQALQLNPDYQPAWYFLAQLRKWSPDDNHIDELNNFLKRHAGQGTDTSAAHYAIAKELEDLAQYEESFEHLQHGATQIRARSHYSVEVDQRMFRQMRGWFEKHYSATEPGPAQEGPIFVLGMPRTGSTLTDRILSSHTQVASVGELMCFRRAVESCCEGGGQPDFFANFFASAPQNLPYGEIGAAYLDMIAPLLGEERYFIDKMPMNYAFVGLIARALPGARFIHTVRNAADTCFSNFKQMFGEGYYGYSYDLESLAEHYKLYQNLMAFWHHHLPGRIYELHYEKLVDDPETEARRLLGWLGLEWQDECLQYHRSNTAVHTASVSQVRQPVYRSSVERWRHYQAQLAPMLQALDI